MALYTYYNPQQAAQEAEARRAAAQERLMALIDQRQRANDLEVIRQEQEMARMRAQTEAAERQGLGTKFGSMAGSAAMGAGIGTAFLPGVGTGIGAAIGAGAGLLGGSLIEAENRKQYERLHGKKKYSFGDGLKDTWARAPTLSEFGQVLGAGGSVAAQMGSGFAQQEAAGMDNANWAATGNAMYHNNYNAHPATPSFTGPFSSDYVAPPAPKPNTLPTPITNRLYA